MKQGTSILAADDHKILHYLSLETDEIIAHPLIFLGESCPLVGTISPIDITAMLCTDFKNIVFILSRKSFKS